MSAFGFDHSYARELLGASVAWKPAPVPAPQLGCDPFCPQELWRAAPK